MPFDGPPPPRPIKVAFTKQAHGYPIHPEIVRALDRAAGFLQDAGYAVEEVATPSILEPAQEWFDVAVHEIHETLGPTVAAHGSETIQRIFDYIGRIGSPIGREDYGARIAARTALTRQWNVFLADYPLVLTPVHDARALPLGLRPARLRADRGHLSLGNLQHRRELPRACRPASRRSA